MLSKMDPEGGTRWHDIFALLWWCDLPAHAVLQCRSGHRENSRYFCMRKFADKYLSLPRSARINRCTSTKSLQADVGQELVRKSKAMWPVSLRSSGRASCFPTTSTSGTACVCESSVSAKACSALLMIADVQMNRAQRINHFTWQATGRRREVFVTWYVLVTFTADAVASCVCHFSSDVRFCRNIRTRCVASQDVQMAQEPFGTQRRKKYANTVVSCCALNPSGSFLCRFCVLSSVRRASQRWFISGKGALKPVC